MRNNQHLILSISDEMPLAEELQACLVDWGHTVLCACDEAQALALFCQNFEDLDLILLGGTMLTKEKSLVFCKMRDALPIPTIFITNTDWKQIPDFRVGVDDFIPTPFSQSILQLRLETLFHNPVMLQVDGLVLNKVSHTVTIDGTEVYMTRLEFNLLAYFLANQGEKLSREQILNGVWSTTYQGDPRTVDTHVKQLRQKLGPYAVCLKSVIRVGYCFDIA